jgi:putative endonuclease
MPPSADLAAAMTADTPAAWFVYLIECENGRLYAGITNDLAARFAKHASGKGAAFMRMSPPLRYVASRACGSRGEAAQAEAALKKLTRRDKLAWAAANPPDAA